MRLIDKDALVAEIIRRRKAIPKNENDKRLQAVYGNEAFVLTELLDFIDDLEVKEVDLQKELIEWHKEHFKKDGTFIGMSGFYLTNNSQMYIAKHFFELGLKAKQG